jgi:ribosomal protein L23
MNAERLLQVILAPVVTEKATYVAEKISKSLSASLLMLPSLKSKLLLNCCSR